MVIRLIFILISLWVGTLISKAQIVNSVVKKEQADLVVFIVDTKEKCDLKVFFIDEFEKLGLPGLWKPVDEADKAQFKIFFTFVESEAQLKIFIVEKEEDAGWVNEEKKDLLKEEE